MGRVIELHSPELDYERMRTAGRELLSLAFFDARNRILRWAAVIEESLGADALRVLTPAAPRAELDPPLWTLGRLARFQEYWIGRNVQRRRGERADPDAARLASILPDADRWFDPAALPRAQRWALAGSELPEAQAIRQYLVDVLETTLDLLASEPSDDDDSLYFYRLAVLCEDLQAESFAVLAQSVGFVPAAAPGLVPRSAALAPRAPILLPATRWRLGHAGAGFAFDNERAAHEVAIPEFEIDAQPVTWAQFGEFVEDGGYDDPAHWSDEGRAWVAREGRRTPRHVDQLRQGVLQRRFGQLARVPGNEAVAHVSHYEAEAWCRWAGRRLPGEAEWEAAAQQAGSRGFRHGAVHEWTASTFRPYPGFVAGPLRSWSVPAFGSHKVLRGACAATPTRLRGSKLRRFARPGNDDGFFGFRSCAA